MERISTSQFLASAPLARQRELNKTANAPTGTTAHTSAATMPPMGMLLGNFG